MENKDNPDGHERIAQHLKNLESANHHAMCWKDHHECAKARISDLLLVIDQCKKIGYDPENQILVGLRKILEPE